ncbi:2-succinyl-5-enolpyruvyl-6-hydroxy-3- cyclohexene -1-carboxylic-acid synthase [Bifidobacterium sp. DSM 109957]|uniref:2-succinyl-5-enolpyruvyl-6-hydroxy-3-cyclohexene -1-carboxylic-acid synthase n=2 Tax=Bifidobacterium oedipodis TaxID=2675322 RepID=A0A7Y0ERS8_9BIFI|nr:2-succinyl-5-enolpyruvyl-6-hydroxy-3- cyclohexene -1-carboxylic-acid synthase [Bifidobacterium sp. DSM 109957]
MYTEIKSYQIIIQSLKNRGIRHCVLSAGSRNVPFVHSVEEDPFFTCYSFTDERSAGYFALGLSQRIQEPVVISCTSATATCNYWPPVAEAFYQHVPLIVLTGDRDYEMLGQLEDQMIDQVDMYDRHVRKSVNLPVIRDNDDYIYCRRLVNEALLELDHNGTGPVHINVPLKQYNHAFTVKELPAVPQIERLQLSSPEEVWQKKIDALAHAKRILVIGGQESFISEAQQKAMAEFFHRFNSAIAVDYMSNVECEGTFNPSVCMDTRYVTGKKFKDYIPDIVITYGGNIFSGIKDMLLHNHGRFEHWLIKENGEVCDVFKSLTTIFECTPEHFFTYFDEHVSDNIKNDGLYYQSLKQYEQSVTIPEFAWSNIYAIQQVVTRIPSGSLLHLSINGSIRITNFFKLQPKVNVYANIGTHGIDGCLPSFLGQAVADEAIPSFLVIGDLSFFYGMNALRSRHIGHNVHILLLNNHGGEEFYYNGMWQNEASDLHTAARHHAVAEGWARSCGFTYLSAYDKASYDEAVKQFMNMAADKPMLFEVFTEMSTDSQTIFDFYNLSRPHDAVAEAKMKSKDFIKNTIGKERALKIARTLGIKR